MHLEMPAEAITEPRDRGRSRAEHPDGRGALRLPPQPVDDVPRPVGRGPLIDAPHHDPHDAPVRRIEQSLADGQLAADERLVVVAGGGPDRRVIWRARLHHHAAAERPAAAASCHLRDELTGSLRGAKVGEVQGRVGVDHADEHHGRKVEPLRDHLRADQDVDLAIAERIEGSLVAAPLPHRVGVHAGDRRLGERAADLLLEPLGAGAGMDEPRRAAVGAVGRQSRHETAAVADAAAARLVEGEGEVALQAPRGVAAGMALHVRRKAAPVEEQHHLPAAVESPANAGRQPRADGAARPTPSFSQVNGDHAGQLRTPHAVGQPAHPPLPRQAPRKGLQRGCRRTEHERHALLTGDPLRHVAGVIPRRSRLLERAFVFFVDHDQAQPRRRGEDRRARSDHDVHPTGRDLPPLAVPLGRREVTVEHRHRAEPGPEAVAGLRGEADLGHEHDRLPPE